MARPLRIEYPGALYHVTARGNRRGVIYEDVKDRHAFVEVLFQVVDRNNWLCHAYCLMDNHYHLIIETPDGNLSYGMRNLNGMYTQWYNRRHRSVGHIFQGRFKSIIVEKDSYLLELSRYVVLNPVRAGMVREPGEWEWSSYRATAGLIDAPEFLTTEWLLSQFGTKKAVARKMYRSFVMERVKNDESIWGHLKGRFILGGSSFIDGIRGMIEERKETHEVVRNERLVGRPELSRIFHRMQKSDDIAQRNRLIHEAHIRYGYTLSEIGKHLGIHYSTVSKAVKGFETRNALKR
ncbi:MAG TPA: transposase [Deltaproteobacteria bacterium]|nr:transposase [Deltaproteobacteria bacterium]